MRQRKIKYQETYNNNAQTKNLRLKTKIDLRQKLISSRDIDE